MNVENQIRDQNRRARKYGKPGTLTVEEWWCAVTFFGGKCAYCQKRDWQLIEHIVPINERNSSRGTERGNCVPACHTCNIRKSRRSSWVSYERVKKYLALIGVEFIYPRSMEDYYAEHQPELVVLKPIIDQKYAKVNFTEEELREIHHKIFG